jgi:hypothetical protein
MKLPLPVTNEEWLALIDRLASVPTHGTEHMRPVERRASVTVMLADLRRLAERDGCVAAAWALGVADALADQHRRVVSDHAAAVRLLRLGSGVGYSSN